MEHRVRFDGRELPAVTGANLREVLRRADLALYNGNAAWANCRGLGTCGTCAVRIDGEVSPPTSVEKWRLSFPPHRSERGLRLACQVEVRGDLSVTKETGFWGHKGPRKAPT
ncbi:MAG: 2Fe-2S iron-sulfur cluster-binding protein [Myxococcota bacterium]